MRDDRCAAFEARISQLEKRLEDAEKKGIRDCIESLRNLQDTFAHVRKWSHSRDIKFAPVELSDYLLINVYNKYGERK